MSWFKKFGFLLSFTIPALVVLGFYWGGYWNFLTLAFVFLVIPLVDRFIGEDFTNVDKDRISILDREYYFRLILHIWVFLQVGIVVWGAWAVSIGALTYWWEWAGFLLSMSMATGGIGITVAHELGHKKSKVDRFFSQLMLMTVCYMHFYIEHNKGHHVWVATPRDPATARPGENFFDFWLRSVTSSYAHAWSLENERLKRNGKPAFHLTNNMIWFTLLPILFGVALTLGISLLIGAWTWLPMIYFFGQAILAFTLLELVNYVEHYGIQRKEVAPGRYERVNPLHSWNASHLISNFFLFELQRHSDHHANAIKKYQVLEHNYESPQLPAGYPTMIMMALVPPLWFYLMDSRLEEWKGKVLTDLEVAN